MGLTTRGLATLKPGEWKSDEGRKGAGRLVAFGMKDGGVAFYFRYTKPDGARDALPLGHYDEKGRDGLTLQAASDTAGALSRRYQAGDRDLRVVVEAERREAERQRREAEAAAAAKAAVDKATLGALLDAYVASLRRDRKESADAVAAALKRHVKTPWPLLWNAPASNASVDSLLDVVAKVVAEGKIREAAKLRAYLRAAYAAGVRARQDARALPALRDLRITSNPARDLAPVEHAMKTRERALSLDELRAYWKRINALPGAPGAALRFHLLTGAQRIEQLSRLTASDLDDDIVRLRDTKGRRKSPRLHVVPLIPTAKDALDAMGPRTGSFLFSVDAGEHGASYAAIRSYVVDVADTMAKHEELMGGKFTVGDLRRTVETRLAAAGIGKDIRAQLQSHGLGGIQAKHYDRHDYLPEKRAALEALHRLVTKRAAKVVALTTKKRA